MEANRGQLSKAIQESIEAGICIVPPAQDGTKRPDVPEWKKYQSKQPDEEQIKHWYSGNARTGIGWVTGKVSGNLEILDFDDRTTYEEFRKAAKAVGLGGLIERIEAGYLEHSPNGAHWMYRCDEISGNTKLASRREGEVVKALIETRGEGGYIIVAPTFGSVNRSGSYKLIRGSIARIIKITPKERKQLFELARSFDKMPAEVERVPTSIGEEGRPGDAYASQTTWAEILEPRGWKRQYSRGTIDYWCRPGKSRGVSATTGHAGTDYMHVFSTSTELPSNKSMGKFSVYAKLEHAGDYAAAARELRLLGFGDDSDTSVVDLSGIMATMGAAAAEEVEPLKEPAPDDDLLGCPGMIGDLARFINETSHKAQPVLALGAAITAVATVIGRKVMLESGLRPNIYVLGVGETGCGKERGRQGVRDVFEAAGIGDMCSYDDIASDAGIVTALEKTPSCLFLLDEFGRVLKALAGDRAPQHLAAQITVYMRLYGASEGTFHGKTYADAKQAKVIDQPSLSIYGTTVPKRLHDSMSSDQVADGLLSRFLVFESDNPDPEHRKTKAKEPPENLVAQFSAWGDKRSDNIMEVAFAQPAIIPESLAAISAFDDMESDLRAYRRKLRSSGEEAGLYTRVATAARKLALIRACGVSVDLPEVTESDAVWGINLARRLTDSLAKDVKERVADNQTEALTKRVSLLIKKAGNDGLSKRELTRKTQNMKRQERQDAIVTLIDSGQVLIVKSEEGAVSYASGA